MIRLTIAILAMLCMCGIPTLTATPPAEQNPFASSFDQLQGRFLAIQTEVNRLKSAGLNDEAALLAAKLKHYQDETVGLAPTDETSSELDIVSIYQGLGDNGSSSGTATVRVTATGRPVVLALSSIRPVAWTLQLDPGATVEKIVLTTGYGFTSTVTNRPAEIPLVQDYVDLVPRVDYSTYPRAERALRSLAGAPVTSKLGQDAAPAVPIVVGSGNSEWRTQRVLHEMHPLYVSATAFQRQVAQAAVEHLRFQGLLQTFATSFPVVQSSALAQMSVVGPVEGSAIKLSVPVYNLTTTSDRNVGYGQALSDVYRFDLPAGSSTPMSVAGPGLPELSWPTGVAFDTKRQRVVLSSLGGEGFLYAYTLDLNQWYLMQSLQNLDTLSLAYLESTDTLYGLARMSWPDNDGRYILRKYSATGEALGDVQIGAIIPSIEYANPAGMQLMPAGDKLALLTPATPDLYDLSQPNMNRLFIINPADGAVLYSGIFPVPEPIFTSITCLLALLLRRRCNRRPG